MMASVEPFLDKKYSALRTFGMNGCANCVLSIQCGGHPLPIIKEIGCVNYANQPVDTDDMNPLFPDRFWALWNDVSGLQDYTTSQLFPVETFALPRYLPLFQNHYLRRSRLFNAPIVALRLFDIVGKRKGGSYGPRYSTAGALRAAYKLRHDTRILLVGVDDDSPLENFWALHRVHNVCEALADLDLLGVTVPNFSYFTCVPRFQILRNRKRILLSAERLSNAGVRVSLHLNANSVGDWKFWGDFLYEHQESSVVTMEFQTGSRANEEVGREAFDQLVELQNRLGRPLHPLLVGAARYYKDACEKFTSFTVIDSQPFMQAVARQVLIPGALGRFNWKASPTAEGEPLDDLIENTMLHYENKLLATPIDEPSRPTPDPNQLVWDAITSTPYLTAQPQA